MSVAAYEPRSYMHDGNYPPMDDHHDPTPDDRYSDPTDAVVNELASFAAGVPSNFADAETRLDLGPPSLPKEESPTASTPQRTKPLPKPDREITKNSDGKYVCTWPTCNENIKEFQRKCEWNKHMDKHARPYKCAVEGCGKLPGFTYSGGLLRHEREVHGKHGGPKNSFNCVHVNCKRHTGKGFSRLENLNEHLRRVHTQGGGANGADGETDDGASESAGQKRKREDLGGGDGGGGGDGDAREELKRSRLENVELRRQVEALNHQTVAMMQRITQLQEALDLQTRIAQPAPML